jgi:hypothetical protein
MAAVGASRRGESSVMRTLPRRCLVLAVTLLLTAAAGWGASPARAPRHPAPAAGLLAPASAWLARLLAPAGAIFLPKAAPQARPLPPAAASAQMALSGHRGCIDPNGSPCS